MFLLCVDWSARFDFTASVNFSLRHVLQPNSSHKGRERWFCHRPIWKRSRAMLENVGSFGPFGRISFQLLSSLGCFLRRKTGMMMLSICRSHTVEPQHQPPLINCFFKILYWHYCTRCSVYHRRKFRSQTSDNMDRWKAEQGRGREKRKIRRKKSRSERVRRKKMEMREKVGKSRNTVFFQWFGAPEGRKVGSLKRRVRSQLARWEMKSCTPLWREAHFEVKMYKTHHCRTTFGSCDVEKVHAVVARSTFRSQNVKSTRGSDHFWKLRCRKSARRCGAKLIWK